MDETKEISRFKVFTLNCWGVNIPPFDSSEHRLDRMESIANYIVEKRYDLVFLQEVFQEEDQTNMVMKTKLAYPHSVIIFGSRVGGSGTIILSKWNILETDTYNFSLHGHLHEVWYADAWAQGCVGMAKLILDNGLRINAYISHFIADYSCDGDKEDGFRVDRSLQALETIDWIHRTSSGSMQNNPESGVAFHAPDLVLLAGDLNTEPGFFPYRVLTVIGSLIDTNGSGGNDYIKTFASKSNVFSGGTKKEKTIDHIFYKAWKGALKSKLYIGSSKCFNPHPGFIEGRTYNFSDHEPLVLELGLFESKAEENVVHALSLQDQNIERPIIREDSKKSERSLQILLEMKNLLEDDQRLSLFWFRFSGYLLLPIIISVMLWFTLCSPFPQSGIGGILLGCVLTLCICYVCIVTVSYRQRWSTVCGKLRDVTLRCKTLQNYVIDVHCTTSRLFVEKDRKLSSSFENIYDNKLNILEK